MDDRKIVELFWARNEDAIAETGKKYGGYLTKIAYNVLNDDNDSEECVNDTYFRAWNAMPPHKPDLLRIFLGKITRECSIDRYRRKIAGKRMDAEYARSLDEVREIVSGGVEPEDVLEAKRLTQALEAFLDMQTEENRNIFLCRYYFFDSVREVAKYFGMTESKVKSSLHRMRVKLRKYLTEEGFAL